GRRRVIIEGVQPAIDAGRFPIKRSIGERVMVGANIFTDGHDLLSAMLWYRPAGVASWTESRMAPLINARGPVDFAVRHLWRYCYAVQAWVDHLSPWHEALRKRVAAGQEIAVELLVGADLIEAASQQAAGPDAAQLQAWARRLREPLASGSVEQAH